MTTMIHSKEETARRMRQWAIEYRANQRDAMRSALVSAKSYVMKFGWEPRVSTYAHPGSVACAVHFGHDPTVDVYCLARNAVARFVNGEDDAAWVGKPDASINLDFARDVIAWEEGQTGETVLDTLDEMITILRGFDAEAFENYETLEVVEDNEGD